MTRTAHALRHWATAGFFGGLFFWYAAHDLSFYLSAWNCSHPWALPLIHLVCVIGCIQVTLISRRVYLETGADPADKRMFIALVGTLAGALFGLVTLWQGIATLIFSGCER